MTRGARTPETYVDCASCPVRGLRCDDCMVSALASFGATAEVTPPDDALPLDANEARAVDLLLRTGLVQAAAAAGAYARRERLALYSAAG